MPVATTGLLVRLEDLIEYWLEKLEDNQEQLGFNFVGGYDERVVTAYPAVVLGSGNSAKEVAGTFTYLIQHHLDIYVYHAEAQDSHRKRSLEMLQTVTGLVQFLEADKTLGGRIVFGYVLSEKPGAIQPRSNPSVFITSTLINYQATLKARFDA